MIAYDAIAERLHAAHIDGTDIDTIITRTNLDYDNALIVGSIMQSIEDAYPDEKVEEDN